MLCIRHRTVTQRMHECETVHTSQVWSLGFVSRARGLASGTRPKNTHGVNMLETLDGLAVANLHQELIVSSRQQHRGLLHHPDVLGRRRDQRRDQRLTQQEINDICGRLSRLENNQVWMMVIMMVGFFSQFFAQFLSLQFLSIFILWPEEGRWLGSIVKTFCINRPLVVLMFFVSMITGVTICGSKFVSFLRRHLTTPAAASPPTDGPAPTPGGDTTPGRRRPSPVSAVLARCLGGATTDSPELFKTMAITLASGQDGNGKAIRLCQRVDR